MIERLIINAEAVFGVGTLALGLTGMQSLVPDWRLWIIVLGAFSCLVAANLRESVNEQPTQNVAGIDLYTFCFAQ